MKAVIVHEYGGPEVIGLEQVERPKPGPGEVLVKVHAVTVNRTRDLLICAGTPNVPAALPIVPGQDPAGEIAALGDGVEGLSVGDRVVVWSRIACGACPACEVGRGTECRKTEQIGIQRWGGYADYVVAPAAQAYPIADRLSFAEAAVVMRHYPMAFQLLNRKGKLKPGQWVLVMGAGGGLGTCGIQVAKYMGARVIAGAGAEDRVALGLSLGADFGVNYRTEDLVERVMEITGGEGVDIVYENISDPTTWPKAFECIAYGGRLVTAGAHGGGKVEVDMKRLYHRRIKIIGAAGSDPDDVTRALDAAGGGHVKAIIDRVMPLEQLHEAFDLIGDGAVKGKIVIDPAMEAV